jgi:hypothetical protein
MAFLFGVIPLLLILGMRGNLSAVTISVHEINDLSKFVDRLTSRDDPVSAFLWKSLSNREQLLLRNYMDGHI